MNVFIFFFYKILSLVKVDSVPTVGIFAIKPIKDGEQLVYNYNWTTSDETSSIECKCGSSNCQGKLQRYVPLIDDTTDNFGAPPSTPPHVAATDTLPRCSTFTMTQDYDECKSLSIIFTLVLSFGKPDKQITLNENAIDDVADIMYDLRSDLIEDNIIESEKFWSKLKSHLNNDNNNLSGSLDIGTFTTTVIKHVWPNFPCLPLPSKPGDLEKELVSRAILGPTNVNKFCVTVNRGPSTNFDFGNILKVYGIELPQEEKNTVRYAVLVGFTVIDEFKKFTLSYYLCNDEWFCYDGIQHVPARLEGEFIGAMASVFVFECCDFNRFQKRIRSYLLATKTALGYQLQVGLLLYGPVEKVTEAFLRVLESVGIPYNKGILHLAFRSIFVSICELQHIDFIEHLKNATRNKIKKHLLLSVDDTKLLPNTDFDFQLMQHLGLDFIRETVRKYVHCATEQELPVIVKEVVSWFGWSLDEELSGRLVLNNVFSDKRHLTSELLFCSDVEARNHLSALVLSMMSMVLEKPIQSGDAGSDLRNAVINGTEINFDILPCLDDVHIGTTEIAAYVWPCVPVFLFPYKEYKVSKSKKQPKLSLSSNMQHVITKLTSTSTNSMKQFVVAVNRKHSFETKPDDGKTSIDQSNIWQVYAIQCPENWNTDQQYASLVAFIVIDEIAKCYVSYVKKRKQWFLSFDGKQYIEADNTSSFIAHQASLFVYECCTPDVYKEISSHYLTTTQFAMESLQSSVSCMVLSVDDKANADVAKWLRLAVHQFDSSIVQRMDHLIFRFLFSEVCPNIADNLNCFYDDLKIIGLRVVVDNMSFYCHGRIIEPDPHLIQSLYRDNGKEYVICFVKKVYPTITEEERSIILENVSVYLDTLSTKEGNSVKESVLIPSLNGYIHWKSCSICGLKLPNNKRSTNSIMCYACRKT